MVAPFNRISKRHCREGLFDFEMATKSACSTGPSSETFPSLASLCCKESSSWSSACNARYSSIAAFAACVVVNNTMTDKMEMCATMTMKKSVDYPTCT